MSRVLKLKFGLNSGDTRTFSIPDPKTNLTANQANTAMTAMITNGGAFADALTSALKAEIVETTKTVLVDNE